MDDEDNLDVSASGLAPSGLASSGLASRTSQTATSQAATSQTAIWRTAAVLKPQVARLFVSRLVEAGIEHRVEGDETGMRVSVPRNDLAAAMQLRPRREKPTEPAPWDIGKQDHAFLQRRYARLLFSIPAGAYLGGAMVELLDVDPFYANRWCSISAIITAFVVDVICNAWDAHAKR